MKKIRVIAGVTLGLSFLLTSCGGSKNKVVKGNAKQLAAQFKDYKVQKNNGKTYDFDGMKIIVADFWSDSNGLQSVEAKTPVEEDTKKFRQHIMNTYNVDIDQYGVGGWDTHPQTVANFCTTGGDENYVFVVDNRSIASGLKASLFYELSQFDSVDWTASKWDKATFELCGAGGKFYACRPMAPEPRNGVFFNKRILREANIDPDSIYDMQLNGTWTWETFEEMLQKTTRDIDNDGVIDIYGYASLSTEFSHDAVASNGTMFIGKDNSGKYFLNTSDSKLIEAMTWATKMCRTYEKPQPEGANWDWMYAAFINGETAFLPHQEYFVSNLADMQDDWGFVCFPLGPQGDGKYKTITNDNVYVIPACYEKDRAEKILKAFDLWSDETPGYGEDAWKEDYYSRFRDSRAVDETLQFMHDNGVPNLIQMINGINQFGDYIWNVYPGWQTPQEGYESTRNAYQALIDEQNR